MYIMCTVSLKKKIQKSNDKSKIIIDSFSLSLCRESGKIISKYLLPQYVYMRAPENNKDYFQRTLFAPTFYPIGNTL